jgi:hypothetical protein
VFLQPRRASAAACPAAAHAADAVAAPQAA